MTVDVTNYTGDWIQVYVQGAPMIKSVLDGMVTFDDVADFGPGVAQPSVGIWGSYRILPYLPLADVQPGETVFGGYIIVDGFSGIDAFGAGKVSWKSDGSALAYAMRTTSSINQIPADPPYGSIGEMLPVVEYAGPSLVAWGPTAATKDQYLYSSLDNPFNEDVAGIYLNTVGNPSGGEMVVPIDAFYGAEFVFDIAWLHDASGFLFTKRYVPLEIYTDIFEYNFATTEVTQLTDLLDDSARELSVSPDGQQVVFERVADIYDTTSSLWIVNIDGSGLHKLADDAGRPAWGVTAPPLTPRVYIPVVRR